MYILINPNLYFLLILNKGKEKWKFNTKIGVNYSMEYRHIHGLTWGLLLLWVRR